MKTYKFYEDVWYASNGCSCCEDTAMYYFEPDGFDINGTSSCVRCCYLSCVEIEDPTLTEEELDALYDYSIEELASWCEMTYNFIVEIQFMEGNDE